MSDLNIGMMIFYLLAAHALADYPLQGDYLAQAKNRHTKLGANGIWVHALFSHSMIHAAFVAYITGVWWIGVCELVAHAAIDFMKCENKIDYHGDQILHIVLKFIWAVWATRL